MGEEAVFYEFLIAVFMGIGALGIFIWAIRDGQMDDIEDVKYRMLEQEMDDGEKEV